MKNKTLIIILSILAVVGVGVGGFFLLRRKKENTNLAGTSGTVGDYKNFLMQKYIEHVKTKNKDDLQKWVDSAKGKLDGATSKGGVREALNKTTAPEWAKDWIMVQLDKYADSKDTIFNWGTASTYSSFLDKAVTDIVEWQATQTNFSKLIEDSQKHGYWYRNMSLQYPRITDQLEFLENVHITGINVNS